MSKNEVAAVSEKMKKCFVITPIGDDDSEIRRHIDGIIDQSIVPALSDKYDIEVAHRKYEIGSINDRVIRSVYESDLVIANLTNLNPNVMFELAMRYSFGKPAIVIAEKPTKLPFDITDENTIFYINDPSGANDLKEAIIKFEKNIDYNSHNYGPVYKSISKIPLYNAIESGEGVSDQKLMTYILDRLDSIEKSVKITEKSDDIKPQLIIRGVKIDIGMDILDETQDVFTKKLSDFLNEYSNIANVVYYSVGFKIVFKKILGGDLVEMIMQDVKEFLIEHGISKYSFHKIY
jgi:hypothetical protein